MHLDVEAGTHPQGGGYPPRRRLTKCIALVVPFHNALVAVSQVAQVYEERRDAKEGHRGSF